MNLKNIIENTVFNNIIKKPYIIAEAGVNHECDIKIAEKLILDAAEGGAHAIKFQSYKADTIAAKESPAYWDLSSEPTLNQHELFSKYDKFWKKEFEHLKICCDKANIEFMSTPFDLESANFLNDLVDVFKISSSDITNKPFIEFISKFKKPILFSTGASSLEEINDAITWLDNGSSNFALMHCILNYPTKDNNANLSMISDLQNKFPGKIIGYSDHTLPNNMKNLEIATLLGAQILEKHFTHNKKLPGNDHYHSMDIKDLKIFIKRLNTLFNILGSNEKNYIPEEVCSRNNARRSLVANSDIEIGEKIKLSKLTWKRPASGISPKFINDIIDKKAQIKIKKDQIIKWDMIK